MSEQPDAPPSPEDDPTSHRSLGSLALVGVVGLLLLGAVQIFRTATTMRPPPPPELMAARDLIEAAVRHHFRGPPGVRQAGLPATPEGYPRLFPGLAVSPVPPPGVPGDGWTTTDAAFRPELGLGALHLRYQRGERYASVFLLPRDRDLGSSPETTYDRPGLRVRLLADAERVAIFVEMLP